MTAPNPSAVPPVLIRLLAHVEDDLREVQKTLEQALEVQSPPVQELLQHVSQFGGKRLRPALVLLLGKALGRCTRQHVVVGTVVEMIHLSSLVHDDVLDRSDTRRNVPTLNSLHGNHVPILLGDFIYSRTFTLAAELADHIGPSTLASTSALLCVGEIEQNAASGNLDLPREQYFQIIEGKTASLYAAACGLAGHYAGASEDVVKSLENFGRDLGVAFQIMDDILDLAGDEASVGKSLGTDLEGRKATLPLIHLVERLDDAGRVEFQAILDGEAEGRRERLRARFDLDQDLAYARGVAEEYIDRATEALNVLPAGPHRDDLQALGDYVLQRDR